jgi:predicted enzyme involved in methoxymalonyl-ACP biosynthesis
MIKEKSLLDISKELNEHKKNKNNFKLKLFIMSNYSTQFLEKSIKLSGLNNNINLEILSPGYNQWEFSIVNFDNIEKKYNPDFILITLSSLLLIFGKIFL